MHDCRSCRSLYTCKSRAEESRVCSSVAEFVLGTIIYIDKIITVCRVLSTSQSETLRSTSILVQQERKWKPTRNILVKMINLLQCSESSLLHFFSLQKGKLQFAAR